MGSSSKVSLAKMALMIAGLSGFASSGMMSQLWSFPKGGGGWSGPRRLKPKGSFKQKARIASRRSRR